MEEYL